MHHLFFFLETLARVVVLNGYAWGSIIGIFGLEDWTLNLKRLFFSLSFCIVNLFTISFFILFVDTFELYFFFLYRYFRPFRCRRIVLGSLPGWGLVIGVIQRCSTSGVNWVLGTQGGTTMVGPHKTCGSSDTTISTTSLVFARCRA